MWTQIRGRYRYHHHFQTFILFQGFTLLVVLPGCRIHTIHAGTETRMKYCMIGLLCGVTWKYMGDVHHTTLLFSYLFIVCTEHYVLRHRSYYSHHLSTCLTHWTIENCTIDHNSSFIYLCYASNTTLFTLILLSSIFLIHWTLHEWRHRSSLIFVSYTMTATSCTIIFLSFTYRMHWTRYCMRV